MREKRIRNKRRLGLYPEFPLLDGKGTIVLSDRRRLRDRRLFNTTLEERLLMLAEMPALDPDRCGGR